MLLSVERPIVGAFALGRSRATLLHCNGLVQAVLPASDWNMCRRTIVVPLEPGRILFAPRRNSRPEIPGYQLQALAAHSSVRERKQRVQPRYRQTKETKCGGMAAGRRSALIVLLKQGNSPWRTLWRKAKRRPADLIEGNMPNTSRFDQHVHVTRLDSCGDHRGWRTCRSRNRMR
jgi:hypothetical protein